MNTIMKKTLVPPDLNEADPGNINCVGIDLKKFILWWKMDMKTTYKKCRKVINVMRCLSGLMWELMLQLYINICIALIRSRVDYGCIACRSASKLWHQSFRVCRSSKSMYYMYIKEYFREYREQTREWMSISFPKGNQTGRATVK